MVMFTEKDEVRKKTKWEDRGSLAIEKEGRGDFGLL